MFERVKALAGAQDTGGSRYTNPDSDYVEPARYEDPHSLEDSTNQTRLDWISENKLTVISLSLLAMAGFILLVIYFGRYFLTIIYNPIVQYGTATLLLLGGGYVARGVNLKSTLRRQDELTLYDAGDGESTHFTGQYRAIQGSTHDIFIPHKGLRGLFHDPEPYHLGEIAPTLVQKHGHDPQEEAKIRLHPSVSTVELTDRGRKVTQLTAGTKPDPHGKESNIEATLPETAASETVTDLKTELEKLDKDIADKESKINQLERQRDDARAEAAKQREEVRQELKSDIEIVEPFVGRRRDTSRDGPDEDRLERKRRRERQQREERTNGQ